jgi:hypothetical protein|uniref:Uncharacterized protein n=1 Tax=Myoviridae sp. ctp4Q36 TaxID=2827708 RepID=A0A8S5T0V2_9CAUD|nr:MAG TPA: protein of unknown function (DUF4313) [Myoviridae sp. ctp4Q36]
MPKTYRFSTEYGDYTVTLEKREYYNGNLAIRMITEDDEVFATMTVNLGEEDDVLPKDQAYLDVNNLPEIEDFVVKNKLAEPMEIVRQSGYVVYPLYKFNLEEL